MTVTHCRIPLPNVLRAPLAGGLLVALALALTAGGLAGCGDRAPEEPTHSHDSEAAEHEHGEAGGHSHGGGESWAVTAWGEHFELFPEIDALVAGETALSHTHVTWLTDFSPLTEGTVEAVLRPVTGAGGTAGGTAEDTAGGTAEDTVQVFRATEPLRAGIYNVEIRPPAPGLYDLSFRIEATEDGAREEIPAGRVRVGTAEEPGGLVEPPPGPTPSPVDAEPISFLLEEQWRIPFTTAWVETGALRVSVAGPGRVRPAAGGEIVLTAPLAGVVVGTPWPHRGAAVRRGSAVFRVTPRGGPAESLARLEAARREVEAELEVTKRRLERLEKLLEIEAVARRQVEEVRARVTGLEARAEAARRELATARAVRDGGRGAGGEEVTVRAPWDGRVARVDVTPGESVEAGQVLARLVRLRPLWLEVALTPADARRLEGDPAGLLITRPGEAGAVSFEDVRQVAQAPEVDPATGTVGLLLEIPDPGGALRLGTAVDAEILLPERREGIVIPASALVDDGGTPVVYVQLDGESFLRRPVQVRGRQGDELLVTGLRSGERLVTRGGAAIRRATLVSSGADHGHVH